MVSSHKSQIQIKIQIQIQIQTQIQIKCRKQFQMWSKPGLSSRILPQRQGQQRRGHKAKPAKSDNSETVYLG